MLVDYKQLQSVDHSILPSITWTKSRFITEYLYNGTLQEFINIHTQGCQIAYNEQTCMSEETLNRIKLMYSVENGKSCFLREFCCKHTSSLDSNSSYTLGGKQTIHTHTTTTSLQSASIILTILWALKFLDQHQFLYLGFYTTSVLYSAECYKLTQLDSCTVATIVYYTQDYLVPRPCQSSHIEKMNMFGVWICSFMKCRRHLLGWVWYMFSITRQYMSGEAFDSLHG
jgi:hypothetical protein